SSNLIGEWRKRSSFERRTTVIRVVKGSGNLKPPTVKYSNGPSTIPMSGAIGFYKFIWSLKGGTPNLFSGFFFSGDFLSWHVFKGAGKKIPRAKRDGLL